MNYQNANNIEYDAIIVGAGFSGLYQLICLGSIKSKLFSTRNRWRCWWNLVLPLSCVIQKVMRILIIFLMNY